MEEFQRLSRLTPVIKFSAIHGGSEMVKNTTRFRVSMIALGLAVIIIGASHAAAGDFWVTVESGHSSRPGLGGQAVLVVRPSGCHEPENATLTATAEGIVNGQRKSMPLKLTTISAGVYEITRQWPSQGTWIIAVNAEYRGAPRAAIVRLGPGGEIPANLVASQDRSAKPSVQSFRRKVASEDIDSALQAFAAGEHLGARATK